MAYQPISCDYYDILEALAVRRVSTEVAFFTPNEKLEHLSGVKIVNLYTREKEEFMELDDGTIIRLDRLKSVNGEELPGSCKIV
ncbi:MAG: hypothetical protein AAFQ37_01645 [Bacteroidota bacterium]